VDRMNGSTVIQQFPPEAPRHFPPDEQVAAAAAAAVLQHRQRAHAFISDFSPETTRD
jgi:hypothetical protein